MPTLVFTASGTWSPPADWPGFATKIECVGAGGDGSARIATNRGGNGGGGGEYAAESGVIYITGSKSFTIGVGGSGTATSFPADTITVTAHAAGNATAAASGNGAGGIGSTNTVHFNGGAGRATPAGTASGGGGGGAAGPNGAGSAAASNIGGAADNSTVAAPAAGSAGNSGAEWTSAGCGTGGSGFASGTNNGTAGGQAGGGGAGASDGGAASTGGVGGHGLIAITYTSATLVPSLGSTQVIAYPQPQHFVLAPGSLFYRQRVADLPPSVVNVGLALPSQPAAGVGAFTPQPSAVLIGAAATQPTAPAFTPQIGALPTRSTAAAGQSGILTPSPSQALSAVIAASDSPPPPFGIEADASPTFVGAGANSGRGVLSVTIGQTPLLGAVAATAPNVALAYEAINASLAAAIAAGSAAALIPAFAMAAAASSGAAASVTPYFNYPLFQANAVGNPGIIVPSTATNMLAGVFATSAFGVFARALNLFPAQSSIQVIVYPTPQFDILSPGLLYYRALGTAVAGTAISLPAIQTLAQVNSFAGLAGLTAVSTQSHAMAFTFAPGVLPAAAATGAEGLFQPANLLRAESGISVLVFPPPQHNVVRPGMFYYRSPGTDVLTFLSVMLPAAAAHAAVGQIGPAFYVPAADPLGVAAPFAGTAPFTAAAATSFAPPLSILQTGINLSISTTGTAETFGPSALLAAVTGNATAAAFVGTAVLLTGVAASGAIAVFPTSVILAGAGSLTAANSFGIVPPVIAVSAVGTPAFFATTDTYLLSGAAANGQAGDIALSPNAVLNAVAALGAAAPVTGTFVLVGAAAQIVAQPFSFTNLRNIPMASSQTTAQTVSFLPSPADTFAVSQSLAAAGNFLSTYLLPFSAISATGNVYSLIARPALLGAAAQGIERPFFAAEQLPLFPFAIALGQTGQLGTGTAQLVPVMSLSAAGELILEIIVVPMQAPFTPVGRGRLVVSTQPNRIRRVLH